MSLALHPTSWLSLFTHRLATEANLELKLPVVEAIVQAVESSEISHTLH